jgi:UDP-N-acetylglucosamine 2-epimerase (non-hydrolysing)
LSKVIHVVAARPNVVKMAPVISALSKDPRTKNVVVHTGQHYDKPLFDDIAADLEMPPIDRSLGVGSSSHAGQTGFTLIAFERVLLEENPDLVIVAGDVNATLACALAAAKLLVPIAHVEAGLRSGDWAMPEEINRVLTDRMSDLLFTHSGEAHDNLVREGVSGDRVHFVGNTMIDSLRRLEGSARRRGFWSTCGVAEHEYVLVTLHRPSNVDDPVQLGRIARALERLASRHPVVFPVHPRTHARLDELGALPRLEARGVCCIPPVSYIDFLSLELSAGAIVTDSGGVQEEAAATGTRCYTLRTTTERPITISHGTNTLIGDDPEALDAVEVDRVKTPAVIPGWDGRAGERIAEVVVNALQKPRLSAAANS